MLGPAEENLSITPPPPLSLAGGVGGYNHHDIGQEVELRPPWLYVNPLGHRVPTTLDM